VKIGESRRALTVADLALARSLADHQSAGTILALRLKPQDEGSRFIQVVTFAAQESNLPLKMEYRVEILVVVEGSRQVSKIRCFRFLQSIAARWRRAVTCQHYKECFLHHSLRQDSRYSLSACACFVETPVSFVLMVDGCPWASIGWQKTFVARSTRRQN